MIQNNKGVRILIGILLVLIWILVPLLSQIRFGISAVRVSFGITVLYYLIYRLWKWKN